MLVPSSPANWRERFINLLLSVLYMLLLSVSGVFLTGAVFVLLAFIDGHFAVAFLVGLVGAIGGALSAVQNGTLSLPAYLPGEKCFKLGSLQQLLFGAGGAFVIMMITPEASESALDRGQAYAANIQSNLQESWGRSNASNKPAKVAARSAKSALQVSFEKTAAAGSGSAADNDSGQSTAPPTAPRNRPTQPEDGMDLFEILALALLGGFAGQWLVASSAMKFVSQEAMEKELKKRDESLTQVKETVEATTSKVDDVKRQRDIDHAAMNRCNTQLDMSMPPSSLAELRDSLNAASDTVHSMIYVRVREAFHRIREDAAQRQKIAPIGLAAGGAAANAEEVVREYRETGQRRLEEFSRRIIPIAECLIDRDEKRRYGGSRMLLAQACAVLGQMEKAQELYQQAVAIERNQPGRTAEELNVRLAAYDATAEAWGLKVLAH